MNRTLWENHNCNILLFLCNVSFSSSGITVKFINRVSECLLLVAHNFSLYYLFICVRNFHVTYWRSCYTSWLIFNQSGYYHHKTHMNGETIVSKTNSDARAFPKVIIYGGNPWSESAHGKMKELAVRTIA